MTRASILARSALSWFQRTSELEAFDSRSKQGADVDLTGAHRGGGAGSDVLAFLDDAGGPPGFRSVRVEFMVNNAPDASAVIAELADNLIYEHNITDLALGRRGGDTRHTGWSPTSTWTCSTWNAALSCRAWFKPCRRAGTGKTALAEDIASALGHPLLIRQASDLMSKFIGETEQNMAAMFEGAKK